MDQDFQRNGINFKKVLTYELDENLPNQTEESLLIPNKKQSARKLEE